MDRDAWRPWPQDRGTLLRVALQVALVLAAVFVFLFFAWRVREAFLLVFAAVVVAVLLLAGARPLERRTGLSRTWSLAVVGLLLLLLISSFVWLLGDQIRAQLSQLTRELPGAIRSAEETLGVSLLERDAGAAGGIGLSGIATAARELFGSLASLGSTVIGALSGLVIVVIGGFFLAADPGLYRRGIVALFPRGEHARVDAALADSGRALHLWLLAELIAMAIVGTLVGLGTWLIGLPAPLALGLFAALTEFVPVIGPVIGAIPALLLALTEGGATFLWTLLLFVAVQQLESNVITPLVQERMVEIPPALLLFAVVAVGLLFGVLGVLIAAPLTVVLFVLVKKLYVRETLGEATDIPGER